MAAPSTAKRILLYRFDRQPIEAIVNPGEYLCDRHIQLITVSGSVQSILYSEIKAVCFAKEPGKGDLFTDENLFERRPKLAGLWARFTFRDGGKLDGILPHDLLGWPRQGYVVTPPRAGLTRQLVFIPREALTATEFHGVVGAAPSAGKRSRRPGQSSDGQLTMFEG